MGTINDLRAASLTLTWDRQTYMPEGGVRGRAEQLATLSRLAHETLVSKETGKLLDGLDGLDPETDDGALVRVARRNYDKATKLPAKLVEEISRTRSLAEPAWAGARGKQRLETPSPPIWKSYSACSARPPSTWDTRITPTTRCSTTSSPGRGKFRWKQCSKSSRPEASP